MPLRARGIATSSDEKNDNNSTNDGKPSSPPNVKDDNENKNETKHLIKYKNKQTLKELIRIMKFLYEKIYNSKIMYKLKEKMFSSSENIIGLFFQNIFGKDNFGSKNNIFKKYEENLKKQSRKLPLPEFLKENKLDFIDRFKDKFIEDMAGAY